MLAVIRRKVNRGEDVLAFVRNNPFDTPGAESMVERLAWLIGRVRELTRVQQERDQARATGIGRKDTVRDHLAAGLLKLFAGAGRAAGRESTGLAEAFGSVKRGPGFDFATSARLLVETTRGNLAALGKFGVEAAMVDEAAALLDEFDSMANLATDAKSSRIQARAELFPVAAEIMDVIARIDGLNRHRFGGDPARLAAWKSALRGQGPLRPRREDLPTGDTGPTEPPAGGSSRTA